MLSALKLWLLCVVFCIEFWQAIPAAQASNLPHTWHVSKLLPSQRCFWQGRPIFVNYMVWGDAGDVIENVPIHIDVAPATDVQYVGASGLIFTHAGHYTIQVTLQGPYHAEHMIVPYEQTIHVDSTPPVIDITSPRRASMVQSDTYEIDTMLVQGAAYDIGGRLESLRINDTNITINQAAQHMTFAIATPSHWGLNSIYANASDTCGNQTVIVQSYLHSANYASAEPSPVNISQALLLHMGQNMLNHLALLLEKALKQNNMLGDMMPTNLATGYVWNIKRTSLLSFCDVHIQSIQARNGGLHVDLSFDDIDIPVDLTLFGSGHVKVSQLNMRVNIESSMRDGRAHVDICPTCVDILFSNHDPRIDFNGSSFIDMRGTFINNAIWFSGLSQIRANFQEKIRHTLQLQLQLLLDSMRLNHSLRLPDPLHDTMQVTSGVDDLSFSGISSSVADILDVDNTSAGYTEISLFADIKPIASNIEPIERGSISRGQNLVDVSLNSNQTFAVAIKDDLINQFFWAQWLNKTFHIDDMDTLLHTYHIDHPIWVDGRDGGAVKLKLTPLMPPVLMPSAYDNHILISIGDIYADAWVDMQNIWHTSRYFSVEPAHISFYVSAWIEAEVRIDAQQRLLIKPIATSHIDMQVVDVSDPGQQHDITNLFQQSFDAYFLKIFKEAIHQIELPHIQVGALPGVHDDTVWKLQHATLERPAGAAYTVLKGGLSGN